MAKTYKVGTRGSNLALKQIEEFQELLNEKSRDLILKPVIIETYGDKDKKTPISGIEGTDFFTDKIDQALLNKKIDFALHSAKDLPNKLNRQLHIACITKSIDPYDVLVSKNNLKLKELPVNAKIGTSSKRRKNQLLEYRKDFKICDLRGNIEERLEKLKTSNLDAIVIASAGLIRLGLTDFITETIPLNILKPHPLQGCLAVVIRRIDYKSFKFLKSVDSRNKTENMSF